MKRLIIFAVILLMSHNIFAQNTETQNKNEKTWYLQIPINDLNRLSIEEQKRIDELKTKTLFGELEGEWFDGAFYGVLRFFDGFFLFFMTQTKTIGAICLALALGIGTVKLIFGGMELNKLLMQIFMSIIICLIMLAIYPAIMKNIVEITTSLSYKAALLKPFKNVYEDAEVDRDFKNYVMNIAAPDMIKQKYYRTSDGNWHEWGENPAQARAHKFQDIMQSIAGVGGMVAGGVIAGTGVGTIGGAALYTVSAGVALKGINDLQNNYKTVEVANTNQLNSMFRAGEKDVEDILAMKIINKNGIISLNQLGKTCFLTLKCIWGNLSIGLKWDKVISLFGQFIFAIFTSLMYLFCICMGVVNYMMCMVQFGFLYGVGVLFIPMMLWEGSKEMFNKLAGSMFNISVHLLVKTLILFLIVFINIEIIRNSFIMSNLNMDVKTGKLPDGLQTIEFYFTTAFLTIFIKLFVDQSSSIADFLCGGSPKLSFGEFAQAAASAGAAGMAAGVATGAIAGGAAKMAGGALRGGMAAVSNAGAAFAKSNEQGGSFGKNMGAAFKTGGASLANSVINGADMAGGKMIDGIKNLPNAAKSMGQLMRYGASPAGALSAEGIGLAPKNPFGGGRGGGDGKGSEEEKPLKDSVEEKKREQKIDNLLNSRDAGERSEGAKMRGKDELEKRGGMGSDGKGISGKLRNLNSGFREMRQADNKHAARGPVFTAKKSEELSGK